jgi:hypothetical protein
MKEQVEKASKIRVISRKKTKQKKLFRKNNLCTRQGHTQKTIKQQLKRDREK